MNVLEDKAPLPQHDWEPLTESFFDQFPEFEFDDFFQDEPPPVATDAAPSPNPTMLEMESFLMTDADDGEGMPSSESDYDKLLEEILMERRSESEEGSVRSEKEIVDPVTPDEVPREPVSKKQIRQMRNRDAAVKSRERKKMYVKDLELKSRYYEGECRRLGYLLQCCYAENHALRLCLQSRGAFGASVTMQESAVLLLELLLLGSLLWITGIMCQLSLPLIVCLTVLLPPKENMEQKSLIRKVAQKRPESKISEYFLMQSFLKGRRCQASRTKMKFDSFIFYNF